MLKISLGLLLLVIVIVAVAILFLRGRSASDGDAPSMMELRDELLKSTPDQLGVSTSPDEAYVAVMDIGNQDAVVSLVTASTGDASLYFSTGGGVIGGIGHEPVRKAAIAFVQAAGREPALVETTGQGLPPTGHVQFLARNAGGLRSATAREDELRSGKHSLSPLYQKGQDVITQLRLVTENRH